jgi:hypothetical protein
MSASPQTGGELVGGRVTLFVSHASDDRAHAVREYLERLSRLGLLRRTFWLTLQQSVSEFSGDFGVEAIDIDGASDVRLFEMLSQIGGVEAVDVVGFVAQDLDDDAVAAISRTVAAIRRTFERWLRNANISDIRVSGRTYDAQLPDKSFFSPAATSRVIIMPLDPSHDYSVFRPFSGENPAAVVGHLAVELASLLGCWGVQEEVPVDALRVAGRGADGNGIHLIVSTVRALAVPAPPVSEALGSNSQLPVPNGFTAVPKPERLVSGFADEIYPEDLVFQTRERPEGPSEFKRIDRFVLRFLQQFVAAVTSLPRVIRQGIQHEMDDLAIKVMEDAIGGAASSVGLVSSRLQRKGAESIDFDLLIGELIDEAASEIDQNYRFGIPASDWQTMSRKILTLADGEGEPTSRLLSDDAVISVVDVLVPACEPSSSGQETIQRLLAVSADSKQLSVVEAISRRFRLEINSAISAVGAALQQLRALPGVIRSRPEIKGDEVIRIAAVVGAALVLVALGAFSTLRPAFAFEWLPFAVRDAAWAFPSALGALIAIWALIHMATRADRARRVVDVVSSLVIPLLLLTLAVQFADVRSWAMRNGGGANYRYAVALFAIFLVLAVLAIRNALRSPNLKNRALGRAGVVIGSMYLLAASIIGLAQDEPPIIDGLPDVRTAVFIVLFPSAVISFGISVSRIAIARVREIYKALLVGRMIEWGIGELRAGRDAEIRLEVLRVQWAALGAVLTRLIRYPLGRDLASALEHDEVMTGENDPLKLDLARLDLTGRGRGGLEARLRQSVVRQGWLNHQLSAIFRSYSKAAGFERGLTEGELTGIDPLACTATPSAEEAAAGEARGDRWALVRDLFVGNFEEILRAPADQIRFDSLYESVLEDPKSIQIAGAGHDSQGVSPFLEQAISRGGLTVPVGFLNLLVTGGDPRLNMRRLIWWPSSLVELPPELAADVRLVESDIRDSQLVKPWKEFGTRFAMSIQVSWSEAFGYDDFVAAKRMTADSLDGDEVQMRGR